MFSFISRFLLFLPVFCVPVTSFEQLCSGSLGDPVIHIDFGTPSNPQQVPPLTGYTYTSSSCPDDGYYTVTNRTSGCFNNSWLTVSSDHTGGGSFLLVNATVTPGDFFLTKISGLCPGTTYEFAAWLMNVIAYTAIKPNLLFTIETLSGTVIKSYNTGDIPETTSPQWKQYGFFFTMPVSNEEIVLRIRNNAPGGIGNDIAVDDITFRPCGPKITTQIQGNGQTVDDCPGQGNSYTLEAAVSDGFNVPAFQWQMSIDTGKNWQDIPGANGLTYVATPVQQNIYLYRLAVAEQGSLNRPTCRVYSQNLTIQIHSNPSVDAGPDRSIFAGDSITLQPTVVAENPTYLWSPAEGLTDPTLLNPVCFIAQDQTYTLEVTSQFGCTASDDVSVRLISGIYVPTAFTPNGDGLNDLWRVSGIDPTFGAVAMVFNVYGQQVYRVENDFINWDGKRNGVPQPIGNYVYYILLNNGKKVMKGMLTLIR